MTITVDGTNGVTTPSVSLQNIQETATVSATASTGTINYDVATQSVLYYTTNASGNFTVNFRGNSGTTLNTLLATGKAFTAVFLNTNGATAYYCTGVSIDGVSQTVKWQTSTPTAGNASAVDVYSFSIIKTASTPTYTVLGTISKFV
jgi:hypothetical protein